MKKQRNRSEPSYATTKPPPERWRFRCPRGCEWEDTFIVEDFCPCCYGEWDHDSFEMRRV